MISVAYLFNLSKLTYKAEQSEKKDTFIMDIIIWSDTFKNLSAAAKRVTDFICLN
jgi:hypothetical protein